MVDVERVLRLLDQVQRDVETLLQLRSRATERVVLDALKYRFITAIERAARVAHHISVSEGWGAPETNADAFSALTDRNVIDAHLSEALRRAAGFRNVLVHQYTEVDDDRVVASLDRLADLDTYVTQVGNWVRASTSGMDPDASGSNP